MATRILGPTGSKKRRRFLFVPILLVACAALFMVAGAQAVHNTKFFQLDGDAAAGGAPTGVTTNGAEDWDTICAAHLGTPDPSNTPGTTCHKAAGQTLPTGGTLAERSVFITDAFITATDNIYKGGTDDGGILAADGVGGSLWQWKEAGPSPNKADIEQAFAAQYTCTAALQTDGKCSTGSDFLGHKYIYFGGTRYANNGDTNIGLWFLHNQVTLGGANSSVVNGAIRCLNPQGGALTSGCGFTGGHTVGNISLGGSDGTGCPATNATNVCTPGDLFVQSAFTSKPAIKIYEWVGPGNAKAPCITNACTLQPVAFTFPSGQTDNRCETTSSLTIDQGCAIVNDQGEIQSPWVFQDQSSKSAANKIEASELFEGGLDLTALGFGDECISTVLLNTRSSGSSVNSTAQDFAIGSFGGCSTELHTTAAGVASPGTIGGGSVSSGTDSATLQVNGVSNWSGTLNFYLCGPIASGTCSDGGVLVSSKSVNQSTSQPISSAVDAQNPGTANLTSAGRYCWFGKFTSATNGVPDDTDDGTPVAPATVNNECFTVSKVTPGLDTVAVLNANGDAIPAGYKFPFGSSVFDTATLSSAAKEPGSNGGNITYSTINATNGQYAGTIRFNLKGPDDPGATPPVCSTTDASGTGTNPQTVNVDTTTGNKTYGPVGFQPGVPGAFHWTAVYTNTGSVNNNSPVSHNTGCADGDEAVTVQQIPSEITTTQKVYPQDSATVTSSVSGDLLPAGGTVIFRLYAATGTGATFVSAQDNCLARGSDAAHGLIYSKTVTPVVGAAGAHSATVDTNKQTDVAVDANGTYYWRVTYDTGDTAHTGRQSDCAENTQLTFVNSTGTGTVFTPEELKGRLNEIRGPGGSRGLFIEALSLFVL
jgi:hypothetical protein